MFSLSFFVSLETHSHTHACTHTNKRMHQPYKCILKKRTGDAIADVHTGKGEKRMRERYGERVGNVEN